MFTQKPNRTLHLPRVLQDVTGEASVTCPANTFADIIDYMTFRFGNVIKRIIAPSEWLVYFDDFEHSVEDKNVHNLGECKEIYLMPVVQGASNLFKRIIGIVLIVVGIALSIWSGGASLSATKAGLVMLAANMMVGIGMTLLMSTFNQMTQPREDESNFGFSDGVNITEAQGIPVPLVYGRTKVGSIQIGTSMEAYRGSGQYSAGSGGSGSGGNVPGNSDAANMVEL